jgi:hypothetical protein
MIRAAILGGGPSLPNDLQQLPRDCILISVNDHAFHHCTPHILVYQDNLAQAPAVEQVLKTFSGLVVSPQLASDVDLPRGWWDGNQSSCLATWFACWLGYGEVILCGMDCYQGETKYCHPRPDYDHPVFRAPLEDHLDRWARAFDHCPHPERISAMSGPLVQVFGAYIPGVQTTGTYIPRPEVRYRKPAWLDGLNASVQQQLAAKGVQ